MFLDLSKVEAGQMKVKIDDCVLQEITANTMAHFTPIAKDKALDFTINVAPNLPETFRTDRVRLEQILRNFLSNAFKFTHRGGVTLDIYEADEPDKQGMLAFAVKDTGIGIPEDKIETVFGAFQQVDASTSRRYGGTGLGLSISREFAGLLGGSVTASSVENEGSTFTLYVPKNMSQGADQLSASPEGQMPALPKPVVQAPATQTLVLRTDVPANEPTTIDDDRDTIVPGDRVILVIEDDREFAKILREKIRAQGHKCLVSEFGLRGIELAETYDPDAIILDIELPDLNGLDLLSRLRKNAKLQHVPVYFMSVHDQLPPMAADEAVSLLTKPVTAAQLRQALDKLEDAMHTPVGHVLVIEDNHTLNSALSGLLEKKKIRVTNAQDGKGALASLRVDMPDCMLIDLGLPDMTAIELLEKIQQSDDIEMPRVIVYSGRDVSKTELDKINHYTKSFIRTNGQAPEELLNGLFKSMPFNTPKKGKMDGPMAENGKFDDLADQKNNGTKTYNFDDKKVLLVDDDYRNIFALSRIVSKTGAKIHVAKNGQEAVNLLNEQPDIDMVLMDIMMPVMDGIEATKLIRKQARFVNMPIVAVTAKAMKGDDSDAFKAGASAYIPKPIDKVAILDVMSDLFQDAA